MKHIKSIGIVCMTFLISGCIPQPNLTKIENPELRIVQQGYSLIPTKETGWVVAARSPNQLALAKQGVETDETFAIQATLFNLPAFKTKEELLDIVKNGQAADIDSSRFTIKKHDVVSYESEDAECVRSHLLTEDNAARKQSDLPGMMLLEAMSIICAHPENRSVGIGITYSQRYYPSLQTSGFIDKASMVIESVKFEKL